MLRAEIYESDDQPLKRPLTVAILLHIMLAATAIVGPYIFRANPGENWGGTEIGGGDAISAAIVSNIPLPRQEGKNVLANESKGLTVSQPKVEEKVPDAVALPDKNAKSKPTKSNTETRLKPPTEKIPEVAPNSIPYGQGGPVSGPYGTFTANNAKGGFGFNNGGDFGSRFSWYVDQVRRKVSENWMKYEVDPNLNTARRVYIDFDIDRTGEPKNIRVEQSSGVPSLDQSAVRALQRIDTFGPLPPQYQGNKVSVEFWFDYRR
jgi:periplasmic protein TonB